MPEVREASMLSKNELFRRLNALNADVVERLIMLWGRPDLAVYINELMSGTKGGAALAQTEELRFLLTGLGAEHDKEFPHLGAGPIVSGENVLAQNAEFICINAKFPRIGQRILATWGSANFCEYTNELMNDKREGHRQGFPEDVVVALFRLMQEHDKQFPQFVLKITDIWSLTNKM